jgi:hypothetical protein
MKKLTQKECIKQKLLQDDEVTNLWAIEHRMLRLGAIIHQLRTELGWELEADFIEGTKNYCYRLVNRPKIKKTVYEVYIVDGRRVVRPRETWT